jgi:hypothetical protein
MLYIRDWLNVREITTESRRRTRLTLIRWRRPPSYLTLHASTIIYEWLKLL